MKYFVTNIEKDTLDNTNFRKVVYTTPLCQVVLMSLNPGEEIGSETHELDQFFRFEKGNGKVVLNDELFEVSDGFAVVVPAGVLHNVINTSSEVLKLYTIYTPPEHRHTTVHHTKAEAESHEEHFDGVTDVTS